MSTEPTPSTTTTKEPEPEQAAANPTLYTGNCHCGATQYSITLPQPLESSQVTSCNCSICSRNGYLLVYGKPGDIVFQKGSMEELGGYEFATKSVSHKFCKTCGSSLFIDGGEKFGFQGINIRMFKDVNLDELKLKHVKNAGDYNPNV